MKTMLNLILRPLILLFVLMFPAHGFAHSKVEGAVPENGAQVEQGLQTLDLSFSRAVRVTRIGLHRAEDGMAMDEMMAHEMSAAEVLDMSSAHQVELNSDLPAGFGTELSLSFDPLGAGIYHYAWIAVADDGHIMEGQGHFEVLAD